MTTAYDEAQHLALARVQSLVFLLCHVSVLSTSMKLPATKARSKRILVEGITWPANSITIWSLGDTFFLGLLLLMTLALMSVTVSKNLRGWLSSATASGLLSRLRSRDTVLLLVVDAESGWRLVSHRFSYLVNTKIAGYQQLVRLLHPLCHQH